jgi:hypothetical protein
MNLADLQAAESKLLLQTYERYPLLFVSGEGVYLRDEHRTDYLDLLSGIGVCCSTPPTSSTPSTPSASPSASPRSPVSTASIFATAAPKPGKPRSN